MVIGWVGWGFLASISSPSAGGTPAAGWGPGLGYLPAVNQASDKSAILALPSPASLPRVNILCSLETGGTRKARGCPEMEGGKERGQGEGRF